jgi:hypothetical protein
VDTKKLVDGDGKSINFLGGKTLFFCWLHATLPIYSPDFTAWSAWWCPQHRKKWGGAPDIVTASAGSGTQGGAAILHWSRPMAFTDVPVPLSERKLGKSIENSDEETMGSGIRIKR